MKRKGEKKKAVTLTEISSASLTHYRFLSRIYTSLTTFIFLINFFWIYFSSPVPPKLTTELSQNWKLKKNKQNHEQNDLKTIFDFLFIRRILANYVKKIHATVYYDNVCYYIIVRGDKITSPFHSNQFILTETLNDLGLALLFVHRIGQFLLFLLFSKLLVKHATDVSLWVEFP